MSVPRGRLGRRASIALVLVALAAAPGRAEGDGPHVIHPLEGADGTSARYLAERSHIAVVELDGNYDQQVEGEVNALPRTLVSREFYGHHPDHYDFLVTFSTFEYDTGDAVAFHLGVRNGVQGIGLPLYDNSDLFGSDGRLQGYVDMGSLGQYVTDPLDPDFERTLGVLAHEILHQWGAYVRFQRPDGTFSDALLGKDGSHWSYLLDSDASVLYGNDWHAESDGTYTSRAVETFFSPLDLYLAGFFGAEEVPPFVLIDNPAVDATQLPRRGAKVTGTPIQVTIDDVIAAEGPRIPAADEAQKTFRAAFVLLVRPGEEVNEPQVQALERVRRGLLERFAVLTGGRAILEVFPEALPAGEPGAPTGIPTGPTRDTEASLLDGLAWLRSRQAPDGSWEDRPGTGPRDTAVALTTLATLDPLFTGEASALSWISGHEEATTDSLARGIWALSARGRDPSARRAALLAIQNPDGGWGIGAGYASDPVDTALALHALAGAPGVGDGVIDAAASFLGAVQGADGGWGSFASGPSRTAVTARVLVALHGAGLAAEAAPAAVAFLASRQNGDGGFGDSPSTVQDTAAVLQALAITGAVESAQSGEALGFLRARQTVDGSWAGSVYATALSVDTLKRFGFPNWRFPEAPTAEPDSPRDGERVRLTFTVLNDGNVEAPAGRLRLYEGDPGAGGVPVGSDVDLPALGARQAVQLSLLWDSFDKPGPRRLVAVLDPDGEAAELSEIDNTAEIEIEVLPAPAEPDLEVTGPDLAVSPAHPDTLPASLAVSATVRNLGQTDVSEVTVQLLVGAAEDAVVAAEAIVSVPQRSSSPVHFTYLLETPGTTPFTVRVDPAGAVPEADETNNEASIAVTTTPAVDLAVSASDLAVEGGGFVGHDVTLRATLHNLGTVESPDTQVRFSVTDGIEAREVLVTTVRIAGGSSTEQTALWRVDLAGDLTFGVEIDPADLVPERDETNNAASIPFSGEGIDEPDLAVDHQELSFVPDPGLEGSPLELSVVVHNFGGQQVTDLEVGFYEGDPGQGAPLLGDLQVIPTLAAGASATAGVTLPPLTGAGDRLIYAVADPNGTVAEFDEANNAAFRSLQVLALPDLAVSASAVESEPALPQAGQTVTTTVTVANLGEQEARDVAVGLAVDGAPAGPDQVLASVPPDGTGSAVFTWSFSAGGGTVVLTASADPENTVPEGNEANNVATRELASFDPNRAVSNPYFSPNGDGIKDTTVYSFTLPEPETVTVEVRDGAGRVVRTHGGAELAGIVQGRFEWDGRDDAGRIVPDGDYRLRAVDSAGRFLDEAPVVVDTDNWPLFAAIGTPYEWIANLSCSLEDPENLQVLTGDAEAVFSDYNNHGGVYRTSLTGGLPHRTLPVSYPLWLRVSRDGEKVAMTRHFDSDVIGSIDGSDRIELRLDGLSYGFRGETQDLVYGEDGFPGDSIKLLPLDGSGPGRTLVELDAELSFRQHEYWGDYLSPDGGKLVYFEEGAGFYLLDLETAETRKIPLEELSTEVGFFGFEKWSPDGRWVVFVTNRETPTVDIDGFAVFDREGNFVRAIEPPLVSFNDIEAFEHLLSSQAPDPDWGFVGAWEVSFSPGSDEIVFVADYVEGAFDTNYSAGWGAIVRTSLTSGAQEVVEWLHPIAFFSYRISTWDGTAWVERGELHHGMVYSESSIDLSEHLPDPDGEYKVRIRQEGLEAGHADRVRLHLGPPRSGARGVFPAEARMVASGEDVLDPLLVVDRDVVDLHEREVEVRWDDPGASGEGVHLSLVAREEDLSGRNALPFTYPERAGGAYHHVVGSGGALTVDGVQTGADGLEEPLFATWTSPDTGHPAATVYGYLSSDEGHLYAALDFTVDNTEDDERDWASVWIETPGGWREFRVTASDDRWGAVGFTRTGRVHHRHKYYEFQIPLEEISAGPGTTVAVRFQAYGTAAIFEDESFLPRHGTVVWAPGEERALYSIRHSGFSWLLDLKGAEEPRRVLEEFTTINPQYVSASGESFIFTDGRDILDPQDACHNPSRFAAYSYFGLTSLANDAVSLEGESTPDGRGVVLSGTATDLHFARWRLEYADEAVAGFWTPIGPPVETPVVDEELAVWIPPGAGGYLVRLTVEDLAGNHRSIARRFASASASPTSITDLHVAPRYVSPNGDGVQDEAILHYRVLAPVHLEIGVFDAAGDRVRTLRRDHSVVGSEHDVVWDGRNDAGLPVPDGRYIVEVQGYSFPVTVDTVAPVIEGLEFQGPEGVVDVGGEKFLAPNPRLVYCAQDRHPESLGGVLSIGDGPEPAGWRAFRQAAVGTQCPADRMEWPVQLLDLEQFVGHRFRLEARDLAGNSSAAESQLAAERLFVHRIREHPDPGVGEMPLESSGIGLDSRIVLRHGSPARLRLAETARASLSRLFVQFKPGCALGGGSGGSGAWQEVELTEPYAPGGTVPSAGMPQHELDLVWDPSFLEPTSPYCVQLRARTVSGQDVLSNVLGLVFASDGLVYRGVARIEQLSDSDGDGLRDPLAAALTAAVELAGLRIGEAPVLWAHETIADPLSDIVLVLTSEEDPRYAAPRSLKPAALSGGVMVFDGSDLLPCHTYHGVVVARVVPADGTPSRPVESNAATDELPCLGVEARFQRVPLPGCNGPSETVRRLVLTPKSFNGVELTLLTLAVGEPDDIVYSVNRPVPDQAYEVEIDTADLPEGSLRLFVGLSNGEGEEIVKRGAIVADRQPPWAQMSYPLAGQRLCGLPDESGARGVTMEGVVSDVGVAEADAELQVLERDGSWPPVGSDRALVFEGPSSTAQPLSLHTEDVEKRLTGVSGAVRARLIAKDAGGHLVCSEPVDFFLDATVEGLLVQPNRDLISPNGDGIADDTLLSYTSSEPLVLDVQVYAGREVQVLLQTLIEPVGDPLRTLASGLATGGGGGLPWDGRTDAGLVVADGLYAVVFRAADGCGNQLELVRGVSVDTTPPQVEIQAPTLGEGLPLVVEVIGTATDAHFLEYQLEHGVGAEPFTWTTLQRESRQLESSRAGLWNTYGLQGDQTLVLTARDRVGNVAAHVVTVTLPVEDSVITDLEAVPDPVSPNGDGRRESTSVRFGFAQEVTASLSVTASGGTVVRSLATGETFPAGAALRTWDGRDAAGQRVPDGEYRVRLEAVATVDPTRTQVESIPLTVDGEPPAISLTRPRQGFASGTGPVQGTVADPLLLEYVVELAEDPDLPAWQEIGRGDSQVLDGELGRLDGLEEGDYALRVSARDAAENRSALVVAFEVDDVAPEVTLDAPAPGSVVGAAGGAVSVRGSVVEEHPHSWRLELGAAASPTAWTELASGDGAPAASVFSWNVAPVADGLYTLRLTAEDLGGLTGEARATLNVDNTPPVATISAPPANGWITGPTPIVGTAGDPHLQLYRLDVAQAGSGVWSELGRSASSVTAGTLLSWGTLPPDGSYQLRLRARDAAGNASESIVPVRVDTRPPAAPQGLTATLENGADARLTWQANGEADLAGYHVHRSGARITVDPVASSTFLDTAIPEGTHVYTVTAVDQAGLESPPSAPAELLLDATPPSSLIHAPRSGSSVSGLVPVRVTAESSDFREYRLSVGAGDGSGGWQLLRRSPAPARSEVVTEWSTVGLPEGSTHTLRLEAEDLSGNVGVALAGITVDNLPPATPTGLAAALTGDDAALTWDANTEADLAGYLLYRDGRLVHGSGDDLVRRALTGTTYNDADLPDGTFTYRLAAIDRAGNLSGLSAPATATLDLRAPHAVIEKPGPGTRFDSPLYVLATTPDRDVAEVRIQRSPTGAGNWTDLAVVTAEPWETTWDPAGLEYGDYDLQAVARDTGGQIDPAPVPITVTYTDLERPAAASGLQVTVDGGDVHLSWTANTEPDLAGYHVDRTAQDGSAVRVTASPVPETSFVDVGLPDDTYAYTVVAVDVYGNEAYPSPARTAVVYSPVFERPFTPTRELTTAIAGTVRPGDRVTVEVTRPGGVETLPELTAGPDGSFGVPGLALERGTNEIAVQAADGSGNRSKRAVVPVVSALPPAAPTGLAAEVAGTDVALTWNPSPEPEVIGYRLDADGSLIPFEAKLSGLSASASSQADSTRAPSRAIDGSTFSYWAPAPSTSVEGQWLAVTWSGVRLVREVRLDWYSEGYHAIDYDLQAWDGGGWLTLLEVRGNQEDLRTHRLAELYPTTGVRILVHRMAGDPAEARALRLAEIGVWHQPLIPTETYTDPANDGLHHYSVTAVDRHGFESLPSAVLEVPVGDAQGPDPVTLTASVTGSDVALSWTASPSTDLRYYLVYRDGAQLDFVFDLAGRTYVDTGLPNGTYRYTVVGVDQVGNFGPPSNEAEAVVAVATPPAPVDLIVIDPGLGDALDLSWAPGAGEPPASAFRVLRAETSGGPYSGVGETTATTFRDHGLTAGTTYYYVVAGLDPLGNAGVTSNEASGTPEDRTGPRAVVHFPAPPGGVHRTREPLQGLVAGTTEPGAAVRLFRDGATVGQAVASATDSSDAVSFFTFGVPRPSPDGSRVWLDDFWVHELVDFETGETRQLTTAPESNARWLPDGEHVLMARFDSTVSQDILSIVAVSDLSREEVLPLDFVDVAVPSPDGRRAAILGEHGDLSGLLLADLETGAVSNLVAGRVWDFDAETITWSPDGSRIAYWGFEPSDHIGVVEVATGAVTVLPQKPARYGHPSWSPDGGAIVYTAADASRWWQVWRYRLSEAAAEPLTSGERDHALPRWSPDGSRVAYVADFARLEVLDLETGAVELVHELVDWWRYLEWAPGGHIVTIDDGEPLRLTPAGRFELRGIPLSVGENRFTAVATDALGNQGEVSEPVIVELVTEGNADLAVSAADLTVLPSIPLTGQEVTLSATVRNLGAAESPPSDLSLVLVPPSGPPVSVAASLAVDALASGTGQGFTRTFTLPAEAGRYTLVATVDGLDRLLESDETNNRAELAFPVLAEESPALFVDTEREAYGPAEDVRIVVDLPNAGPTFTGEIAIAVEDSQGFLVEELPPVPVDAVAPGEIARFTLTWNTTDTFAGDYRVAARLVDAAGAEVASDEAPFAILSDARVTASVTTDRALYEAGETVRLVGTVRYESGNGPLTGVEARLRVLGAGDEVRAEWLEPLGELLPGAETTVAADWPSTDAAAGAYRARLDLLRGGAPSTGAESAFELAVPNRGILGSLALSDPAPPVGTPVVASFELTNATPDPLAALPVEVAVTRAADGAVLATEALALDLAPGATHAGEATFATDDLRLEEYLVVLRVTPPGTEPTPEPVTLAAARLAPVDTTPPEIRSLEPSDGAELTTQTVEVRAVVFDPLSGVDRVEGRVDAGPWRRTTLASPADGLWVLTFEGLVEGPHEIEVRAQDRSGNEARRTAEVTVTAAAEPELLATETATLAADADGDGAPSPGDELLYQVDVTNTGGGEATDVLLTHPIPEHTALVAGSLQTTLGTVVSEDPVEVSLGVLAGGESATVTFRATIDLPVPPGVDRVVAQGAVTSAELPAVLTDDPAAGGATDPTVTLIEAAPELVAEAVDTLVADPDGDGVPSPGDTVGYTITVRNVGNTSATAVALAVPVPLDTALVAGSATSDQGTVTEGDPVLADLGEIPGQGATSVAFQVVIDDPIAAGVREISAQGLVTSAELPDAVTDDPEAGGAADPTVTPVSAAPVLRVEKTALLFADHDGDGLASPGDEVLYRVRAGNTGNTAATGLTLVDPIPEHTLLEPGTVQASGGSVVLEDPVTVTSDLLPVGEELVLTFRTRIAEPFPLDVLAVANAAELSSAELAPVPSDDPATPEPGDPTVTEVFITPEIALDDVLVEEGESPAVFRVSLSEPGNREATVDWRTVAGSAAAGLDFEPASGRLTFAPGTTEALVEVAVLDDGLDELDEAFRLVLESPAGAVLADAEATATILDDDPPPFVSVDDVTVGEGPGAEAVFTVALSGPSGLSVTVDYATADGGARGGSDYVAASGTVTIPAGLAAAQVRVPVLDDDLDEPDETFFLTLSGAVNAVPADSEGVATVVDDDPPPTLSVADASVAEANETVTLTLTARLSTPSGFDVSASWATADGTARAGEDYEAASGTLEITAGATETTLTLNVLGDPLDEPDETFRLVLAEPAHVILPEQVPTITIVDDDPPPELSIGDATVPEGDTGSVEATLSVTLSAPSGREVQVGWTTVDGLARAGADYVANAGTLVFPEGVTEAAITVTVLGDLLDEFDETLSVVLQAPVHATLGDAEGTLTLLDDDPLPELVLGETEIVEGDSGSTDLVFPATLSVPSGREVRATWSTTGGTAKADSDYTPATGTLVFPEGGTSASAAVQVTGDLLDELDETVRVELSEPVHALLAVASAEGTILDDDEARISVGDVTVDEGDEGPADALFPVDLATEADREITVRYSTSAGTATAEEDFTPVTGLLVFPPFETHRTIAVPVLGDRILEPEEETFTVELSEPTETSIEDGLAVGTIRDDELCPGADLLANPGAEERLVDGELPGWVEVEGTEWTRRLAPPEPAEGEASFWAGTAELGELAQDADVAAYEVRVDGAGGQRFAFSGRVRTFDETPPDTARIVVEYRDRTNSLALDTFDSGELVSPGEWLEVTDERVAPAGTGWIRVRLIVVRFTEGDTDAYFDALALRSLRAPVLTVADAVAYEGDGEPVDATFAVRLSCPYHREVSAPYATADGTAVAGEDYVETSGVVTLLAGETEAPVAVPLLGDEVHELHETFLLELGTPTPADEVVALDAVGTGVITNDDFCPRSHGFWKTHGELWPAERLTLGGVEYERPDLQAFLEAKGGDVTLHLARELVATKLNLLVGSDPWILPTVATSDDLLVAFPPGSNPRGEDRQTVGMIHGELDDYNNSRCEETPVEP